MEIVLLDKSYNWKGYHIDQRVYFDTETEILIDKYVGSKIRKSNIHEYLQEFYGDLKVMKEMLENVKDKCEFLELILQEIILGML